MSRSGSYASSTSTSSAASKIRYTCNIESWKNLKMCAKSINQGIEKVEQLKKELETGETAQALELRVIASEVENLKVENEMKAIEIDRLRRICAKKRRNIAELKLAGKQKEEKLEELKKRCEITERFIHMVELRLDNCQRYHFTYMRLVRHRSKLMIDDLRSIFRIELKDVGRTSCGCKRIDSICGVHLPPINLIGTKGHLEVEYTAAIGYLVQLLECIAWILDYNFRYQMTEASSNSYIFYPREEKTLPLFGSRWKADRERLDGALNLLGKNIAQLRGDCGLSSPEFCNFLQSLKEWIEVVVHGKGDVKYLDRPWKRLGNPAMLLDSLDEEIVNNCEEVGKQKRRMNEYMISPLPDIDSMPPFPPCL